MCLCVCECVLCGVQVTLRRHESVAVSFHFITLLGGVWTAWRAYAQRRTAKETCVPSCVGTRLCRCLHLVLDGQRYVCACVLVLSSLLDEYRRVYDVKLLRKAFAALADNHGTALAIEEVAQVCVLVAVACGPVASVPSSQFHFPLHTLTRKRRRFWPRLLTGSHAGPLRHGAASPLASECLWSAASTPGACAVCAPVCVLAAL